MSGRIDLMEELVNLHSHEETLAFFEFRCVGAESIRGLCRISKPKVNPSVPYLSLTFTVDASDAAARAIAEERLAAIDEERLKAAVPVTTGVMSMPVGTSSSDHYICQIDVMLEERVKPGRFFIGDRLIPALGKLAQLALGEVVWWAEADSLPG